MESTGESRVQAWEKRTEVPLLLLALAFLVAYAWPVLDPEAGAGSRGPRGLEDVLRRGLVDRLGSLRDRRAPAARCARGRQGARRRGWSPSPPLRPRGHGGRVRGKNCCGARPTPQDSYQQDLRNWDVRPVRGTHPARHPPCMGISAPIMFSAALVEVADACTTHPSHRTWASLRHGPAHVVGWRA